MANSTAEKRLAGKAAIVTGSARGIGAAIAEKLAEDGAGVVVNYVHRGDAAEAVVGRIRAAGGHAAAVRADVAKPEEVRDLVRTAMKTFDRLDVLVNNAAVFAASPLEMTDEASFDEIIALNARGVFFATKEAAARMRPGGRIINMSSDLSRRGLWGTSVYAGAKAAIEAFTRVHAAELAAREITVNAISPGVVDTDGLRAGIPAEILQRMIDATPLGRIGLPRDVADLVAFFASDDSRWLTGQVVHVNGGAMMS